MSVRGKLNLVITLFVFASSVFWLVFLSLSGLFELQEILAIAKSPYFLAYILVYLVLSLLISHRVILSTERKKSSGFKMFLEFAALFIFYAATLPIIGLKGAKLPQGLFYTSSKIANGWFIGSILLLILGFLTLLIIVKILSKGPFVRESFSFRMQILIFNTTLASFAIYMIAILAINMMEDAFEENAKKELDNLASTTIAAIGALDRLGFDSGNSFASEVMDFFHSLQLGVTKYPIVIDTAGSVILYPPEENWNSSAVKDPVTGKDILGEILRIREGWIEYFWEKPGGYGVYKKIARFVYYKPRGAIFVFSVFKDEFCEPVFGIARRILLVALIFVLLAYTAGVSVTGSQVVLLSKILEGIEKISAGDFDVHIDTKGNDEIAEIGHGINVMAVSLQERRKELKHYATKISAFYEASLRLMSATTPDNALRMGRKELIGILNARDVWFLFFGDSELISHVDLEALEREGVVKKIDKEKLGPDISELLTGKTVYPIEIDLHGQEVSAALIPFYAEGGVKGALVVDPGEGEVLSEAELKLLGSFATFLSSLVERLLYARNLERLVEERTRELEISQKKFRILFEKASEGIFIYDLKADRILEANRKFLEMVERGEEEIKRIDPLELVHPDEKEKVRLYTEKRMRGDADVPLSYTTKFVSKSGRVAHVRLSLAKLSEDNIYAVIVTDITELVRLQDELEKANIELKEKTIRDPLTGAYNRRKMKEVLEVEMKKVSPEYPLAFIMADLDDFKVINDKYGHQVGDFVLRSVYKTFQNYVRDEDWIFRYGGEEFVILLPCVDIDVAKKVGERLRRALDEREYFYRKGKYKKFPLAIRITASFGIAVAPFDAQQPEQLVNRADIALYVAKKHGKNRVVAYSDLSEDEIANVNL